MSIHSCDNIRQDLEKEDAVQIEYTSSGESWKESETNSCRILLHSMIFGKRLTPSIGWWWWWWWCLPFYIRHLGILEKIMRAIRVLYNNSRSSIFVDGLLKEEFEVTTRVLQGYVLAPFLFHYYRLLDEECRRMTWLCHPPEEI